MTGKWEGILKASEGRAYWRGVRDEILNLIDLTEQDYLENISILIIRRDHAEEQLAKLKEDK